MSIIDETVTKAWAETLIEAWKAKDPNYFQVEESEENLYCQYTLMSKKNNKVFASLRVYADKGRIIIP